MPFGLGKKGDQRQPFVTNITDKQDLEEFNKISHILNPNEEVFVVCVLLQLTVANANAIPLVLSTINSPAENVAAIATINTRVFFIVFIATS
jgi:hypothetical protein